MAGNQPPRPPPSSGSNAFGPSSFVGSRVGALPLPGSIQPPLPPGGMNIHRPAGRGVARNTAPVAPRMAGPAPVPAVAALGGAATINNPIPTTSPPAFDVPTIEALLDAPEMADARRHAFYRQTFSANHLDIITRVHNILHLESATLTNTIIFLEASHFDPALTIQDWRRFSSNDSIPPSLRVHDSENPLVDRSTIHGGSLFDPSKLVLTVKKDKTPHTYTYDAVTHGNFDHHSPRDILRLNRQRHAFLTSTIGTIPATSGKQKDGHKWHDLERWAIASRYAARDRHAPDFPAYRKIADEHNKLFVGLPLPGFGTRGTERQGIDSVLHRDWLGVYKDGSKREGHRLAMRDIRKGHEKRRGELAELEVEAAKVRCELVDLEEDEREAALEASGGQQQQGVGQGDEKEEEDEEDEDAPGEVDEEYEDGGNGDVVREKRKRRGG